MKIVKVRNKEELGKKAAELVTEKVYQLQKPILGLATGSTPETLYENLIRKYKDGKISFNHTTTFNLDEYVGIDKNDSNSYRYYMDHKLFNSIDIKQENTHIPDGLADNLEEECQYYERLIKEAGKIDLQVLGLGLNGHIGFNEPGTPFDKRTHVVELDQSTREANARFFNQMDDVPTQALTMGIGTIMEASEILLLVQGEKKAEILKEVMNGEITEEVPASILQRHPRVTLITDIDI